MSTLVYWSKEEEARGSMGALGALTALSAALGALGALSAYMARKRTDSRTVEKNNESDFSRGILDTIRLGYVSMNG